MGLIDIAMLRSKAAQAKIAEITGTPQSAVLHINSIQSETVEKLTKHFGSRFTISAVGKPAYIIRLKNGQKMSELTKELANAL